MEQRWGRLVGTWTLDDVTEFGDDGQVKGKPYGNRPTGQLMYAPDAHMAVVVSGHGSAPAAAYAGRVIVVDQDRVRHVIAVGLPPFTEDQERFARLEDQGARLVLATDGPGRARLELSWVRCPPTDPNAAIAS